MFDRKIIEEVLENIEKKENENRVPKNLVQIKFNNGQILSYFSDLPEIKKGSVVTVEGKRENDIGVVEKVLSAFKKPNFEMKWVKSIIDSDITGSYFMIDEDAVSLNHSLTAEKFLIIYGGVKYDRTPAIGEDNIELNLDNLEESELFEDELIKIKGRQMFKDERVSFISLKDGVGKAIVRNSKCNDWYEIDFRCKKGKITYLACDCPYFGNCKHAYAFLLKLKDFWKKFSKITNSDSFVMCKKWCFNYIMAYAKGKVTIDL